jgi:CRP/FNR family cyclic AMP-dependent transcriptional regulator
MEASLVTLKQIPLLQSLSESEQTALAPLLKPVQKQPGEILFRQGETGNALYFLLQGRVKFTFRHDTGQPDTFEEIGPGNFFGEVAVFTLYGQRTATAEVTQALEAYELSRKDLVEFLRKHPDASLHLLGGMAERMRRAGLQLQHTQARNLNQLVEENLTPRDRLARSVAEFAGSPPFLKLHAVFYTLWIVVNVLLGKKAFDPPPFHLLALIVGVEALVFSCFVLMNQYREDKAQKLRNDEEYKMVAYLHERMDDLHRELVTRLPVRKENARKAKTPDP